MGASVILGAARTPFGKLGGGLARFTAVELGARAIRAALDRSGVPDADVDYVVMGQVLQAGVGQIPSRQAQIAAGLPREIGSETVNKVCASGLRAVALADQMIRAGGERVVVAGGMESMSNAPYLLPKARFGYRLGDGVLVDAMTHDGLVSTFDGCHMIEQASSVARELGITREEQDAWAYRSHVRAVAAIDGGTFSDELVAVEGVEEDEAPRRDTSLDKLSRLPPVMDAAGTTTVGNAPGLNDGAAALVVASEEYALERGLRPLAGIVGHGLRGGRLPVPRTHAGACRPEGPRARGPVDRRHGAARDQRGVLLRGHPLDPHARRGCRARERQRGRRRAGPSDRCLRRPARHDARPRAPARRRGLRPGRDLLGRRPGRRDDPGRRSWLVSDAMPEPFEHVLVVGAGQMGAGIAQVVAVSGRAVTLVDEQPGAVERGLERISASLEKLAAKNAIADPSGALARIEHADDLIEADLMIEAIVEDPWAKEELFRRADESLPLAAILASNTSSIPITRLGAATGRPDRVVGMHFFNPVPVMALVEVIRGLETSTETAASIVELARALGKTPAESRDFPGFVANRILMPLINEAAQTLMEGVADAESIDTIARLGLNHPMGPLALADLIGLDTCVSIMEVLHAGLGDPKYAPCPILRQYVQAGRLGRKSGQGFYAYGP